MTNFFKIATLASILIAPAGMALAAERTVTLDVDNMTCASCPLVVRSALTAVPGVERAQVSFRTRTATVTYDDARTTSEALTQATAQAGFPARIRLAARGS